MAAWTILGAAATLAGALAAALGCRHKAAPERPSALEAASARGATDAPAAGASASASFAALPSLARARLIAVAPLRPTDALATAPLVDEAVALQGTRADGSALVSFRRGRSFYELSSLREEGDLVWLRAIDREAPDRTAPLALVGISVDVLDGARTPRVGLDRRAPRPGRATVIARVVDARGAPRGGVRALPTSGATGPRVDDAKGELVAGEVTGPLGVVVYDDVDAARGHFDVPLSDARGGRALRARVEADVVTTLLVELP